MESEPQPQQTVTLTELFLRTGILALKVLIPMIWLQSKLSPIQFLIGGTVLVLVAFLFDFSPTQDSGSPSSVRPSNLRYPGRVESPRTNEPD
ncbi:uncharacterized protein B0H64DRAFT_206344 [Chaetomium fimeti]|uniref:Uncharacterized protein n=1 Tax=Chaetomium fimeti TaxID=1854472 RepID=A0AAE0HB00_9PEZI|nr:hypothetical protein B0H64DRAFT_206344 [Chaetomium fimeti]